MNFSTLIATTPGFHRQLGCASARFARRLDGAVLPPLGTVVAAITSRSAFSPRRSQAISSVTALKLAGRLHAQHFG